jgi:hypothetical protein
MCPSCGPAQGYDPALQTVCEWLQECVLADIPEAINVEWLSEELANRLGHRDQPQSLADEIYRTAQEWQRREMEKYRKRLTP